MKYISLCFFVSLISCSVSSVSEDTLDSRVEKEIQQALSKGDTRLYYMGGRVPNFPGIHTEERERLIAMCGKKLVLNTSDILFNEEEADAHELAFKYAKRYNTAMKSNCLK